MTFEACIRAIIIAALVAGTVRPSQAADSDEIAALRDQIRVLDQRLRELESKQQAEPQKPSPPGAAAAVTASPDGFALSSADRNYRLRLWGNAHADARFFLGDDIEGNDTFLIRRLRLSFEGNLGGRISFKLMPDITTSTFSLYDAYVSMRHSPALTLVVGKMKAPFDLERLVAQTDLLFMERAYPTSLAPNRDTGLQLQGELARGRLQYQVALMNGARDNDSPWTDWDDDKEVIARVFAEPFRGMADSAWRGFGLGVAMTYGDKAGCAPNGFRTNAQQTFFSWRSSVANHGAHTRLEPQAYYYFGPLGLIGSWVISRQAMWNGPGTFTRDLTNTAWYVAAHWVLTGEDAGYRGVMPAANFELAHDGWGAFELAVRIGALNVDDEAFPLFADPRTSAQRIRGGTLGLNWYVNRHLKASLNYEHSRFTGGAANPVTREEEQAILTRLQVRY